MVLILLLLSVPISVVLVVAVSATVLAPKPARALAAFKGPFECGFTPKYSARSPFSLQFFAVALIFLVFDMELILLYPFLDPAGGSSSLKTLILIFFLAFLSVGFFVEWSQKLLEWVK